MVKIKDLPKIDMHLKKSCAICGQGIEVVLYKNRRYRGGHYFGKIPLHSKKEMDKAAKAGFIPWRWKNSTFYVFKKDPKPHAYVEYWECQKCYWDK